MTGTCSFGADGPDKNGRWRPIITILGLSDEPIVFEANCTLGTVEEAEKACHVLHEILSGLDAQNPSVFPGGTTDPKYGGEV